MSKKRDYHVVPSPRGGWTIRREGLERANGVFDRKSDAMEYARRLARDSQSEMIVHRRDGRITDSIVYGKDPRPPRDRSRDSLPKGYGSLRGEFITRTDVDTTKPVYGQAARYRKARASGSRKK
jgi:hypothetical protein